MPSVLQSELPKPKSWDEFEDLVWDLYARRWNDPNADRYGRTGQRQHGVDICGRPPALGGRCAGVQCKRYAEGRLTRAIVEREVKEAETFHPPLAEYTIATTDARDGDLQSFVLGLCQQREREGKFPVYVVFWETLCGMLADPANRDILRKHYGEWRALFADEGATPVERAAPAPEAVAAAQERYLQRIIEEHGRIRILGQTGSKPLKDIFTDVYVLDQPTAFRRFDPAALQEQLWAKDRGIPWRRGERRPGATILQEADKLFILGKPGAGKTTLLKYLAVREAMRGDWGECLGKLPIFVPLHQLADTGQTPFEFIVEQFALCDFPGAEPFVNELLRAGQALVLFDGLDEVPGAVQAPDDPRGDMIKALEQFTKQYGQCHIVITCRVAATEYAVSPAFTYLELADFDPDQAETFVRQWFHDEEMPEESASLADQMLAEWREFQNEGIRDLTRNPLLLALLCLAYEQTQSFPARSVDVYEEALRALLKKWDTSRGIRRESLYGQLSLGRKERMFAQIAYDTFVAGEILFEQRDLEGRIKGYLVEVPGMPDPLDIDAEKVLHEIVAQHGIFTEQAHCLFSFTHLTFQEYYTARHIWKNADTNALEVLAERVQDAKWREVVLLTASRLQNATRFLTLFERALQDRVARHPQFVVWLRRIDEYADVSQAGYRRSATRLFYLYTLAHYPDLDHTLDREIAFSPRDFAFSPRDFAFDNALSRDIALNRDFALALARALDPNIALALDIDSTREHALAIPRVRGRDRAFFRAYNIAYGYDSTRDFDIACNVMLFCALSRALDLDLDIPLDLDISLARTRVLDSFRALCPDPALACVLDLDLDHPCVLQMEGLVHTFRRLGEIAVVERLKALDVPEEDANPETWEAFADQLHAAIEGADILQCHRQLQAEAKELREKVRHGAQLDEDDLRALVAHFQGTRLFYDCLQLAYTPEREGFEDRIFAPPLR